MNNLYTWLPIGISVLSLMLAAFAIGWNIYRDVILKARVKVSFAVVSLMTAGQKPNIRNSYLRIRATNHGPGIVQIENIHGKNAPIWRRLLHQVIYFVVMEDNTNPLNVSLPHKLNVSETLTLLLPYNIDCLLGQSVSHIGLSDSYNRLLFAPKRDLRRAKQQYKKDFRNK